MAPQEYSSIDFHDGVDHRKPFPVQREPPLTWLTSRGLHTSDPQAAQTTGPYCTPLKDALACLLLSASLPARCLPEAPFAALVVGDRVLSLAAAVAFVRRQGLELSAAGSVLAILDQWPRNFPALQRVADALAVGSEGDLERAALPSDSVRLHPPVDLPRQVFCSGANYKKHVIELHVAQTFHKNEGMSREERLIAGTKMMDERAATGTPFFFCKAQSTVVGPHDSIVLPADVTQPDWEAPARSGDRQSGTACLPSRSARLRSRLCGGQRHHRA